MDLPADPQGLHTSVDPVFITKLLHLGYYRMAILLLITANPMFNHAELTASGFTMTSPLNMVIWDYDGSGCVEAICNHARSCVIVPYRARMTAVMAWKLVLECDAAITSFIAGLDSSFLTMMHASPIGYLLEQNIDDLHPKVRCFYLWVIWDMLQGPMSSMELRAHHAALVHKYKCTEIMAEVPTTVDLPPIMGLIGLHTRMGIEQLIGAYVGRRRTRAEIIHLLFE